MKKTASCVGLGITIAALLVGILAGCGDKPPANTFDPSNNNGPGGNAPRGPGSGSGMSNGPGGGSNGPSAPGSNGPGVPAGH